MLLLAPISSRIPSGPQKYIKNGSQILVLQPIVHATAVFCYGHRDTSSIMISPIV